MLDQIVNQVLGGDKSDLVSKLTSQFGASDGQAKGFLEMLIPQVLAMLKSGKFDIASLLGGNTGALKDGLNLNALGQLLGGGAAEGEKAVDAVAQPIGEQLKGMGDLDGILGQLGDLDGMLDDGKPGGIDDTIREAGGGMLGKLFGKK